MSKTDLTIPPAPMGAETGASPHPGSTVPFDTTADAHAVQREVYRRIGGRGRLAIMFRLNHMTRQVTMAGIRARHPEYTDDQVLYAYARLVLGDAAVRAAWPDRTPVDP